MNKNSSCSSRATATKKTLQWLGLKKSLLFLLFVLSAFAGINAQVANPVKWKFESRQVSDNTFELIFKASIDEHWHLYSTNIPEGGPIATSVNFTETSGFELVGGLSEKTKPEKIHDPNFGMDLGMFSHQATFVQKIKVSPGKNTSVSGYVEFMSCDDQQCLPPKEADFNFLLTPEKAKENTLKNTSNETKTPDSSAIASNDTNTNKENRITNDTIAENNDTAIAENNTDTKKESIWNIILLSILGGFGALITPCVYPIIPLTVSFFMRDAGKRKGVYNGILFGLSIMFIYTLIGFLVGITGINFTGVLASHWLANLIFFALFLTFALSFFGLFEIMLPTSLANKIDQQADKGGLLAPFFMALATVVISFSCTGPIVGVLLGRALQGEILSPVIGMFSFSFAFALPFTLLAIFPTVMKNLPKSGGWLNSVKVVFAFILIALGMKFLVTIDQTLHLGLISRKMYLAVWISLSFLLGLYLLGKIKFSHDSEMKHLSIPRFFFAAASFAFMVYLLPGMFGAELNSLASFLPPKEVKVQKVNNQHNGNIESTLCGTATYSDILHFPHGLEGYFDYEEGITCAKEQGKPALIIFKGHACSNCKEMEAKVWPEPAILEKMKNDYILIGLYVDDRTKLPENQWVTSTLDGKVKNTIGKKWADFQVSRFNTNTQPYHVIVDPDGKTLKTLTKTLDKEEFLEFLK